MNIPVKVDEAVKLRNKTCLIILNTNQNKRLIMEHKNKVTESKDQQIYITKRRKSNKN